MFDINDDAKSSYRRVEVLTGPGRRRHWSAQEKAQAVAESLAVGARVSDVARRWQICPQQLYTWRRALRSDGDAAMDVTSACSSPAFVPIIPEAMPAVPTISPRSAAGVIEIQLAGALVRVRPGLDDTWLAAVLRAVRASAVPA